MAEIILEYINIWTYFVIERILWILHVLKQNFLIFNFSVKFQSAVAMSRLGVQVAVQLYAICMLLDLEFGWLFFSNCVHFAAVLVLR